MPNGYDPEKGRVLVPFDLKSDVILPLERLEDGLAELSDRLDKHIHDPETVTRHGPLGTYVQELRDRDAKRAATRAKAKKTLYWTVGIGGPVLATVIARLCGVGVGGM